jgi:nitroreductase
MFPALTPDSIGLLEGICTTRAIRRYRDEPIPDHILRDIMFAATRAPSGSNRQPFRFIVLSTSPTASAAKQLIATSAQAVWKEKQERDGYSQGSGIDPDSPKSRMAQVMNNYVQKFEQVPVLVLACLVRYREPHPEEGASIYPACQNILLAARALGYGGALTGFHHPVEQQLRELLNIPEGVHISACITLGKPEGNHGPVRRRRLADLVFEDSWDVAPIWAIDPEGTAHTAFKKSHTD